MMQPFWFAGPTLLDVNVSGLSWIVHENMTLHHTLPTSAARSLRQLRTADKVITGGDQSTDSQCIAFHA
jgi:hypothetical protein